MLRHQRLKITTPIINRIPIIRRLATRERISKLPEHIARNTRCIQRRRLPRTLNRRFIGGDAVFF